MKLTVGDEREHRDETALQVVQVVDLGAASSMTPTLCVNALLPDAVRAGAPPTRTKRERAARSEGCEELDLALAQRVHQGCTPTGNADPRGGLRDTQTGMVTRNRETKTPSDQEW